MKKWFLTGMLAFLMLQVYAQTWSMFQDTLLNGLNPDFWTKSGSTMLSGEYNRIYQAADMSQPWLNAMNGIPNIDRDFVGLVSSNDTAYVLTYFGKLFQSVDAGSNWTSAATTGIPPAYLLPLNSPASINAIPGRIFISVSNDTCYSSTDGNNWSYFNRRSNIGGFYHDGVAIWTSTAHDTLIIYNAQLQPVDTNYYNTPMPGSVQATALATDHRYLYGFSYTDSTIYRIDITASAQPAVAWGTMNADNTLQNTSATYRIAGRYQILTWLYVSPTSKAMNIIYFSNDSGQTWMPRTDMRWFRGFVPYTANADSVWAMDNFYNKMWFTGDRGNSWSSHHPGINALYYDNVVMSDDLDTILWRHAPVIGQPIYKGIVRSTDGGATWGLANNGLPPYPYGYNFDSTIVNYRLYDLMKAGNGIYTIVNDEYIYRTTDAGQNWQQVTLPQSALVPVMNGYDENSIFISQYYYPQDTFAYYRSDDQGMTWIQFTIPVGDTTGYNMPRRIQITGKNDTLLLRYNQRFYQSQIDHFHLVYSTDNGLTWTDITPPQTVTNANNRPDAFDNIVPMKTGMDFGKYANTFIQIVEKRDTSSVFTYFLPQFRNDSLYMFQSGQWSVIQHSGLPADIDMQALEYDNGTWYLSSDYGVYESTDDGVTWSGGLRMKETGNDLRAGGLDEGMRMYNLKANNGRLVSGTRGYGIWHLTQLPLGKEIDATAPQHLHVFPNPATGGQLSWQTEKPVMNPVVTISDMQGRVLYKQREVSGTTGTIETPPLAAGVYVLEVTGLSATYRTPLVIGAK